ncbi:hypothetical protein WJX73_002982 [Symbiochloris irregularis]|uniref:Uncharacterized protein n=1 Tax=Symbiochloris irregularis TaxID=706552 RepID=A0AAW1PQF8_9CHLO
MSGRRFTPCSAADDNCRHAGPSAAPIVQTLQDMLNCCSLPSHLEGIFKKVILMRSSQRSSSCRGANEAHSQDMQILMESQRKQVDRMQLSLAQLADLFEKGSTLFARLRQLDADLSPLLKVLGSSQLPEPGLDLREVLRLGELSAAVDAISHIRDLKIQTMANGYVWLTNSVFQVHQLTYMLSTDDAVLPSMYLQLVVMMEAMRKPRAPRLPQPSFDSSAGHWLNHDIPNSSDSPHQTPTPAIAKGHSGMLHVDASSSQGARSALRVRVGGRVHECQRP